MPLEVVPAYWLRFNAAFGIERTESERETIFIQRLEQRDQELELLAEAYAENDIKQAHIEFLEQQI